MKSAQPVLEAYPTSAIDPAVGRMKARLLGVPYEVCMARAKHFTDAYKTTEGQDPHLRNAEALRRTLTLQKIRIEPDERLAGSKTERFLAGPLSVERGDFLRSLQLEMDILEKKLQPFQISDADRKLFWKEILPYWSGKTVRDRKGEIWNEAGIIKTHDSLWRLWGERKEGLRYIRYLGPKRLRKLLGAGMDATPTPRRVKNLIALRYEFARNNPTPAVYCFDVQGHLSLGVDRAVELGLDTILAQARDRLARLEKEEPSNKRGRAFLQSVMKSLEATIAYANRFADEADRLAVQTDDPAEKARLALIAQHCRHVPRHPPRTFHEALQSAWLIHVVGEIQYGTHEVFAAGRIDQFLYPLYKKDIAEGRLDAATAVALLQEYFLKLSANAEPIPEAGMETNGVLGNSQHCVVIGGQTETGESAVNPLSHLILDAYGQMGGSVNQLCVRLSENTPTDFRLKAVATMRRAGGLAFFNDETILRALEADGYTTADARDYVVVGCIETSGQSDTHGCPGGHELVLPVVLTMALTRGKFPPPALGQTPGIDCGDPTTWDTFDKLLEAFRRQLNKQIDVLIEAARGKDEAYQERLPAPYVSALMADCIERAKDIVDGGARYDFTSVDVRGLATTVDSLCAIRWAVYEQKLITLPELISVLASDFKDREPLRKKIIHSAPKYGNASPEADQTALEVINMIDSASAGRTNARGGRFRSCYYSYGNHVIDGFMLGATPDGRKAGQPISNGVSPSNLISPTGGPLDPMRTVAGFPPAQISSGVSLNLRFHPDRIKRPTDVEKFSAMLDTYFALGGMHLQPNVVDTETLKKAQANPEQFRDLVVKVSGYSAYFTDLGKSIQDDIIARTEFGR